MNVYRQTYPGLEDALNNRLIDALRENCVRELGFHRKGNFG